jgi:hypothetical protein
MFSRTHLSLPAISVLHNFVATHVLQTEVARLHEALRQAKSLDETIEIHDKQYAQAYYFFRPPF